MLDFSLVEQYVPFLLKASVTTLEIFIFSIALGLVMGIVIVIMKISKFKPFSLFANFYIWTLRGTPLLVQLFLVYFGLPQIGVELAPFPAAVLALGINAGAYIAEILRGGILSIPKGQMEAAQSLGLSYPTIMRRIIFPQAFRVSIPAIGNESITLLKDSSLASLVTVSELMMTSQRFASTNYAFIEFYISAALLYLIMTTILSFFLSKIEFKMSISEH
ncbi:amino acid ABC transporter permease [Neobacillus citreus]|uniref:Amino acid ABC transporter permease n=1 Tax=Neobacillus citreus TaxID=2833578 RepID=A0A942SUV5_9BACI|nr:amino acid ABC transporter permease [Neobacillus citreus]MCH6264176.1 amino acid ABC transporter permease [Neobacillus citreus]